MKKKEIKISNEEMMELMGLKRTSNSDDNSDKTAMIWLSRSIQRKNWLQRKLNNQTSQQPMRILQVIQRSPQRLLKSRNCHRLRPSNAE